MNNPPRVTYTTIKQTEFMQLFQHFIQLEQEGRLTHINPENPLKDSVLDNFRRVLYSTFIISLRDDDDDFSQYDYNFLNLEINSEKQLNWLLNDSKCYMFQMIKLGSELKVDQEKERKIKKKCNYLQLCKN